MLAVSITMLYYSKTQKTYPGFKYWTIAAFLLAFSYVISGFRNSFPYFFSIGMINVIIGGSWLLIMTGLEKFYSQKKNNIIDYLIFLIFTILIFYSVELEPNVSFRVTIITLYRAYLTIYSAVIVYKGSSRLFGKTNLILPITLVSIGFLSLLLAGKSIFGMVVITDFLNSGIIISLIISLAYTLSIILYFNFILINNFRTSHELNIAEQEIKHSEELFRAVFDQAGGYCMILQPTDNGIPTIHDVNKTACEAHGYNRNEMIGKPVADLDDEEGKRLCIERTQQIMSGNPFETETNHIHKDGSIFPVAVYANIVHFENRSPLIVTTEFDISERKKTEADKQQLEIKLQQAQKLESIGQLAGGIAHDFNNILYPIIGFAQLSQDELPKGHPVQENLQDILDGAIRAKDLVKRILYFSRQKDPELRPTILEPVIKETQKLLRSTIPSNVNVQLNFYDGQDAVLCDDSEIHEILVNLCTNAYHASAGDQSQIVISLEKKNPPNDLELSPGEYLCISVKDDGVGIPEKIKNKIFEPYVTTKEIGKGSGLGLSVVYGIVQNYDGGINVESSSKTGTVFEIFLPITDQAVYVENNHVVNNSAKDWNTHILFVDDENSIVKLGVRALKNAGYRVSGIKDSTEALKLFEANPNDFDLVITDMAMPGMVGSELAKRILKVRPDVPIIICSGYSEKLEKMKAKELKVSAFLDKPLTVDNLVKNTREVLKLKIS